LSHDHGESIFGSEFSAVKVINQYLSDFRMNGTSIETKLFYHMAATSENDGPATRPENSDTLVKIAELFDGLSL